MWEIALLIIAIAFAVAVVFAIPVLLQLLASAKELEFTLRETREAVQRLLEIAEKAEAVIDKGHDMVSGVHNAFVTLGSVMGTSSAGFLSRTLVVALKMFPVAMTVRKLFTRCKRRKDHV